MTPDELRKSFEQANAAGDFENAYAIEQQLKELPQEQRSALGEFGRQLGLTGRAIAGGAAQMAEPFTEPVRYLMNKALPGNPIGNIETATDEALTAVGVPEPQGALEEGVQSASRFAAGFATGGLAGKSDDAVLGLLGMSNRIRSTPVTAKDLRGIADTAYDVADKSGVVINPTGFKSFVDDLSTTVNDFGISKKLHKNATAALKELQKAAESGTPLKLKEIETLRKIIGDATQATKPADSKIAFMIRDALDDYTNRLGSSDVLSGDPRAAMAALKTARDAWHRMSKSNDVAWAVERAGTRAGQFSGSGFENALRTEFRQIAMNKKRLRGYSPEEKAAIKHVASGGRLDNAFRTLGKLAPTGGLSMIMSPGAGYAVGGPVGMVALPVIGAASRRVATNRTMRNVDDLNNMVLGNAPRTKDAPEWLLPWLSGTAIGADVQE